MTDPQLGRATAPVLAPDVANRLGCAQDYEAVVHFQGGRQVHARLDSVVEITWGRKLDDYSEASVTLAKRQLTAECWRKVGGVWETRDAIDPRDGQMRKWLHMIEPGVEPWMHELSIYRDKGLVWQGPITEITETRTEIEIQARDVLFWMDRRVIDITFNDPAFPEPWPIGTGLPNNAGAVCRAVMEHTFPTGDPYNNPNIAEHWRIDNTPTRYIANKTIWKGSRTAGDLIRDVIKQGIDMFTLGRKVYMIPDFDRTNPAIRSPYRLTDEHFMDDLEIHKLGLDLATEGFVISQPENTVTEPGKNNNPPPNYGKWPCPECDGGPTCHSTPPWYGRIVRFDESESRAPDQGDAPILCGLNPAREMRKRSLQEAARAIREYGFPCPKSIVVPDGAALAPETPLHINQLVPGRAFLVELTGWATPISEIFALNELEVTWTSPGSSDTSQGGAGGSGAGGGGGGGGESNGPEQVKVSLATTRAPAPVDDTGGDTP